MTEVASGSSSAGLSLHSKGIARRETMQSELAQRTSSYFMQVQQRLFTRMYPAKAVPRTVEELAQADVSMTSYLEQTGGYKTCRDTSLVVWILAHAVDAAALNDFHATKEYGSTHGVTGAERVGWWNVAYILSLMEEHPQQLFGDRQSSVAATGHPFAPLVPPSWAAVALAYLKEIEVLSTRKVEMKRLPAKPSAPAPAVEGELPANPKRKPLPPGSQSWGGKPLIASGVSEDSEFGFCTIRNSLCLSLLSTVQVWIFLWLLVMVCVPLVMSNQCLSLAKLPGPSLCHLRSGVHCWFLWCSEAEHLFLHF